MTPSSSTLFILRSGQSGLGVYTTQRDAAKAVDQVLATDITYIPLHKGFLYLVAIMDLNS